MQRAQRKPCPSCGKKFQRGASVWRVLQDGPARQRVCRSCAAKAVPLLASDAPAFCEQCGLRLARFCHGCVGEVLKAAGFRPTIGKRRGRKTAVYGKVGK